MLSRGGEEEEKELEFQAPQDLEEDVAQADRHELVDKALQKLPPAQRVPLVLYHMEGMHYEDIAAKLNISLGKVKTDIFRGREALRQKLRLHLEDDMRARDRILKNRP